MNKDIENIKEQLEQVIKKNLPEKVEKQSSADDSRYPIWIEGHNEAIDKIPVSLIADEVLKVVVEKIKEEKQKYIKKNEREYGGYQDEIDTCRNIISLFKIK